MIHRRKHPEYIDGCFGCKISTISFGTVPGGAKDARTSFTPRTHYEQDLHRYRDKRAAGEQPEGTTRKAMEKTEKLTDLFERRESDLRDLNPPEKVAEVKKSLMGISD